MNKKSKNYQKMKNEHNEKKENVKKEKKCWVKINKWKTKRKKTERKWK